MSSLIFKLDNNGRIHRVAEYSVPPRKALVCYIKQTLMDDFNTWDYPQFLPGMWESEKRPGNYYYDIPGTGEVLASSPAHLF